MSSYCDYPGIREDTLCSKDLAYELLEIPTTPEEFFDQSNSVLALGSPVTRFYRQIM